MMANLYVNAVPPAVLNRKLGIQSGSHTQVLSILILLLSRLLTLSIFGCSPADFVVTYHFFHWKKGTPFAEDQGIYNGLTWWNNR